jgi:hypothetical protein
LVNLAVVADEEVVAGLRSYSLGAQYLRGQRGQFFSTDRLAAIG